ncbi:MAG: AAA family ATPase [Clostridia bacterium]|nr:AAA family ATPase [Clostridia bacterium]MDD4665566.1 AAA family ATPase [Clostridia bacterium]
MSMRLTFYPQQREQSLHLETNNFMKNGGNISPLALFKNLKKTPSPHESETLRGPKIEEILQELDSLIGLASVKKLILEIQAFMEIQKRREKENLLTDPLVFHAIFKGNPGTGKTTVARILGNLFKEMGILKKGHVIEVERADLVGEYIGHTALKTREQIKNALGGVLFIDEAYSLARGGEKDFGKEAIDTMVKAMEDHKNNLILILAGYKEEMSWFLQSNPGLRSRFPLHVDFPDYSIQELLAIAEQMLLKRQYQLTEEAKKELENILTQKIIIKQEHHGNARLVRNLIEKAIRRQAVRLVNQLQVTRNDLILITWRDLQQF